jgi:hypothetical protein
MNLRFAAFFATGFLGGVVCCWARIQCLQARLRVMEFFFRQRINTQLGEVSRPLGDVPRVRSPKVA